MAGEGQTGGDGSTSVNGVMVDAIDKAFNPPIDPERRNQIASAEQRRFEELGPAAYFQSLAEAQLRQEQQQGIDEFGTGLLQTRFELAEHEANHDHLTGLFNSKGFTAVLEQEAAEMRRREFGKSNSEQEDMPTTWVIAIDVNGLKLKNDTEGHQAGNDLLTTFSQVLTKILRESDIKGRLGGDEFALCLPELSASNLRVLYGRLEQALSEQGMSASFGAAELDPSNLKGSMRLADLRSYRAKKKFYENRENKYLEMDADLEELEEEKRKDDEDKKLKGANAPDPRLQ